MIFNILFSICIGELIGIFITLFMIEKRMREELKAKMTALLKHIELNHYNPSVLEHIFECVRLGKQDFAEKLKKDFHWNKGYTRGMIIDVIEKREKQEGLK